VPLLLEPNDQIYREYCKPVNFRQLSKPFNILDSSKIVVYDDPIWMSGSNRTILPGHAVTLVQPAGGITSLLLELSWQ
jgi:hypothetical protein